MVAAVALVSDSTSVDPVLAERLDAIIVPLHVLIDQTSYDEGDAAVAPERIAEALRSRRKVGTSRPAPQVFVEAYRSAAIAGASSVLSIHLSSEVSGTYESALLAAREVDLDVVVVDSRQLGLATGFAVSAAAAALEAGATAAEAGEVATRRSRATTALFYVHTLEYLRRGGRVGITAAVVGSALSVKPLLTIDDGRIVPLDKVRTSARALSRLEELAVEAAGTAPVDLGVAHLASPDRAEALASALTDRIPAVGEVVVSEVGAVLAAHVGPGMVAVVVSPRES